MGKAERSACNNTSQISACDCEQRRQDSYSATDPKRTWPRSVLQIVRAPQPESAHIQGSILVWSLRAVRYEHPARWRGLVCDGNIRSSWLAPGHWTTRGTVHGSP